MQLNAIFNSIFFLVWRLDLNKKHDLSWAAKVLALNGASSIEAKMIIST